jgi:hypothetical protein
MSDLPATTYRLIGGHGRPLAVCTADWHLTLRPPASRAESPAEWLAFQGSALAFVGRLAKGLGVPILHAGDVFDRWDAPPELINWAIETMPVVHAVPGNHDLPNHSLKDLRRSAFWTLKEAGKVCYLRPGVPCLLGSSAAGRLFFATGFPHGCEPKLNGHRLNQKMPEVAVVHGYCYFDPREAYPGADPDHYCQKWAERLSGFTAAVFGDNHRRFVSQSCGGSGGGAVPNLVNCGALVRHAVDEAHKVTPTAWVLYEDGWSDPAPVEADGPDRWRANEEVVPEALDAAEFVEELKALGDAGLNFAAAVAAYLRRRGIPEEVKAAVREIMGGGR